MLNNLAYMAETTPEEPRMTPVGHIKIDAPKAFSVKRFTLGMLCVLLVAAMGSCSEEPSPPEEKEGEGYIVIFEENGGDTPANPQSKRVVPPATTVDTLPEPPIWEGHRFMGWNMEADGSGMPFSSDTPVSANLTVYAQWELFPASSFPRLSISISPSAEILTPILHEGYSERSTTFGVVVSGFANAAEASNAWLSISATNGLAFTVNSNPTGNIQNFSIRVVYDGEEAFPSGVATFNLSLIRTPGYETESRTTTVNIRDGLAAERAIPLNEGNIISFNHYARTAAGLVRHYRLMENVSLSTTSANNWTAIGAENAHFRGSLNGGGHTLYGLRISTSSNYQGLFRFLGEGAVVENLGLLDVSVSSSGQVIGSLAGFSNGTVQNCYATGAVRGSYVGGLLGGNGPAGSVQNSYATTNVNGGNYAGGLVGENRGTIEHSYATGTVNAANSSYAGGLVGQNFGTLRNSVALNQNVCASAYAGRVTSTTSGSLSGNLAFSGTLYCGQQIWTTGLAENTSQGENRTASALQTAYGFPAALLSSPWTYLPDRLPGLFGQTVAMPSYIH